MKRVRNWASGQSLVLFVIFLTVLLGVSALGIDYATWLLTDRKLQNVTDSAVTAGASAFGNRIAKGSCATSPGDASCDQARLQAWTSINDALELGMDTTQLANISTSDRYALTSFSGTNFRGYTIWVTTPPPNDPAYTGLGGRLTLNFGIVWARVDVTAPSFFSNVFGIGPSQRHGWATAGTLPTDFALQIFCRTSVDPSCGGSGQAALVIDGQGGIRLIRGDIGSNESLKVTAQGGNGVILESGYMFLVNGVCGSSSWNCPQIPAVAGGIADDNPNAIPNTANNSNAFYIPPQPVPHYASPTTGTVTRWDCNGASSSQLCVPYQDQSDLTPNAPGDWACGPDTPEFCGAPDLTGPSGTVSCVGTVAGNPGNHYYVTGFAKGGSGGASITNPDPLHPQSPNSNNYLNIDEDYDTGNADTTNPPGASADDYLYTNNLNVTGSGPATSSFTVTLGPSGPRQSGASTVRFVSFWSDDNASGAPATSGNPVTLSVSIKAAGSGPGWTYTPTSVLREDGTSVPLPLTLTTEQHRYEFPVLRPIASQEYNSLVLQFNFSSTGSTSSADERGGAISWAEIEHPEPNPYLPPFIPPGYYRSIEIADGGCAVLDPTAEFSSLQSYQMPGIYRFGGTGSGGESPRIQLGTGAYLIGDGVTLVFDSNWPASGSGQGIALGTDSALVLNTAVTAEAAASNPCTPYEEVGSYNPSNPLSLLPHSSLCAAWGIDPTTVVGTYPGGSAWGYCDPASPDSPSHCVERDSYSPIVGYRGITFYFTPTAWDGSVIQNRFEMQGTTSGLAFRGIMFAPFDDVKISGANGFNTVGQVLAWTAKFNGGSAFIDLDYPYEFQIGDPYLLEPTVNQP